MYHFFSCISSLVPGSNFVVIYVAYAQLSSRKDSMLDFLVLLLSLMLTQKERQFFNLIILARFNYLQILKFYQDMPHNTLTLQDAF